MESYTTRTIIVTGRITSGKTTFLNNLVHALKKYWRADGFISLAGMREHKSGVSSEKYVLKRVLDNAEYLWAVRNNENKNYDFCSETEHMLAEFKAAAGTEVFVADDIGFLELEGRGCHSLIKRHQKTAAVLLLAVKKALLAKIIARYELQDAVIVDLDELSVRAAKKKIFTYLFKNDSEKIALFSTLQGGFEASAGSVLHALRVPFKGHFLAGVQNFMMILFGKELRGRNLVWIAFVSASLKAFSPAGSKLKPMLYIFMQGALFGIFPQLFGWNFAAVLAGSLMLEFSTAVLSLFSDYVVFGPAIFDTYLNGMNWITDAVGIGKFSLMQVFCAIVMVKFFIAGALSMAGYYLNFERFLNRIRKKIPQADSLQELNFEKPKVKYSVMGAFRDILSFSFVIPFIFIVLFMMLFSAQTSSDIIVTVLRGLLISWFGFLAVRSFHYSWLFAALERRGYSHISASIRHAAASVKEFKKNK